MVLWQFGTTTDKRQVNVDFDSRSFCYRQRLAGLLDYLVVFKMWNQEATLPRPCKWLHSNLTKTTPRL